MLTPDEFGALISILNRAPKTQAEAIGLQVIISKIAVKMPENNAAQEVQEKRPPKENPN